MEEEAGREESHTREWKDVERWNISDNSSGMWSDEIMMERGARGGDEWNHTGVSNG